MVDRIAFSFELILTTNIGCYHPPVASEFRLRSVKILNHESEWASGVETK